MKIQKIDNLAFYGGLCIANRILIYSLQGITQTATIYKTPIQTESGFLLGKMSKKRKKLTKGQKWFRSLTPDQRKAYMVKKTAEKDEQKSIFRRNKSIRLMKPYAGQFNCKDCIHGKTESCTDNLENGCEYFEDLITGRSARFLIGT